MRLGSDGFKSAGERGNLKVGLKPVKWAQGKVITQLLQMKP